MPVTPTLRRDQANPIHVYRDRKPYRLSHGRQCKRPPIEDRLENKLAMVALDQVRPSRAEFLRLFRRELKTRSFTHRTIKAYCAAIASLLRWFALDPHHLDREHVKDYLAYLYDAGQSPSTMSVHLSAIRDAFDKYCFRDVTLGLATPKPRRRKIIVLSRGEVRRILQAAPSLRDTLMIGLMYGSGMRVGELTRLRWRDIDIDRNQIFIRLGKGQADRFVQLPRQYRELLRDIGSQRRGDEFMFPSEDRRRGGSHRHISPRTVQRVVRHACELAGVNKQATPHSFRHAFATHSFEDGCDIRRIQTVLGHARIETTTIYINVAGARTDFPSPLDRLGNQTSGHRSATEASPVESKQAGSASVGTIRLHTRRDPSIDDSQYAATRRTQITIELIGNTRASNTRVSGVREYLTGTVAEVPRDGLVAIAYPPNERWEEVLQKLPSKMSERVRQPKFFQTLQQAIITRMTKLHSSPPPDAAGRQPA